MLNRNLLRLKLDSLTHFLFRRRPLIRRPLITVTETRTRRRHEISETHETLLLTPLFELSSSTYSILNDLRRREASVYRPQPAERRVLNNIASLIFINALLAEFEPPMIKREVFIFRQAGPLAILRLLAIQPAPSISAREVFPVEPMLSIRRRVSPQPPRRDQLFAAPYYERTIQASKPAQPLAIPRNEDRLNAVKFPEDLVPEKFRCELMSTVMDNPVRLPDTGNFCDGAAILKSLESKKQNPFNRQPMRAEDAEPQTALREEIRGYVDGVVKGVNNRQKELGGAALSRQDYEAIHQAVRPVVSAPRLG